MITPGGFRMSVAMTNCGTAGWVSDRRGYHYDPVDPESGAPWPAMPAAFADLAARPAAAAGFDGFVPDACLITPSQPGPPLPPPQQRNQRHHRAPILPLTPRLPAH